MDNQPQQVRLEQLLNIGHSNAQSIIPHLHDLEAVAMDNNLHVLGISESFLKPDSPRLFEIPHYRLFRVDRLNKSAGGVAMYVHESIPAREVCRSEQPTAYRLRPEYLFLELTIGRNKILCGTIYSPPKAGFWSDVEDAILNCNDSYDFTFLMGDFNIEWHSQSSTRRTLADSLICCHLEVLPFATTHHTDENTHSTIDYICVSDRASVESFKPFSIPSISKHDILLATLQFALPELEQTPIKRRSFRNFNLRNLLIDLAEVDWRSLYLSNDLEFKVKFITEAITRAYDAHAPYRVFVPRKPRSPWITPDIKRVISARNKAWRQYKHHGAPKSHYTSLRNTVKRMVRNARFSYFKNRLARCPGSANKWKVVEELGLTKARDVQTMPATPDQFNTHFIGAAGPSLQAPLPLLRVFTGPIFNFRRVDAADVLKAFARATSNALGTDAIPLRHLRDCIPIILNPLVNIFDASLRAGCFPAEWKHALVRPLPKKASAKDENDLRPVSILTAPSKLFEGVALEQIMEFVLDNNVLDEYQSGFRKGHSTNTAVTRVVDDFRVAINNEHVTLVVGIDFSRAFDLVNIDLLVSKLYHLGFSDRACTWIESYLANRSQSVVFSNGDTSSPLVRNAGVPQGSLLGPPLFSLFINDLPRVLGHCKYQLYADDLVIYLEGNFSEVGDIVDKINYDLTRISRWASNNGLVVNASKTQAMWVGSRGFISRLEEVDTPDVVLDGTVITPCASLKILGVIIDSTLSWREQCNITARKCFAALRRLRKCRAYLTKDTRLLLIKALIFPYFSYCASAFLDLSKELTLKLSRCLNAALRFVTGTKIYEHITPVYRELEILPYAIRHEFGTLCFLAKILNTQTPAYLYVKFKFVDTSKPGCSRKSKLDLAIHEFHTECLRNSFYIGAAYLWNSIPVEIRSLYKRPCFKNSLFVYLLKRV